ncbi:MAG: protein kinase [Clostridia bacterium]|nr:protein kinase [Clostridia bacterium]
MLKLISERYRILESIGTGGMSEVYKAIDEKRGKVVAIKVLKEEYQKNADFIKRFRHEASAAAKVSHPNIVKLYNVGNDGDLQYLVMEYIEGRTLKQVIEEEGRLKSERAVRYALKILAALDHAHKNNIIHRDIKPQNILVDADDDIKVTDFGIARLVDSSTGTLTDSNSVLGSVHYVSPEQANGDPVDAKSDLYSMGVVLYEMLTGTVPFDGDTAVAIALKQVNELPRSMRFIYRDIPRSLDEVVMKALEKAPEMRYKTAAEMAKDLKRALRLPKGGFVNSGGFYGRFVGYIFRNGLNAVLVVLSGITVLAIVIYGFVKVSDILYGVDVPSVVGMDVQQAVDTIKDSDMIAQSRYVYDDAIAEGQVISQDPEANARGRRNKTVTLTVSQGIEPIDLPDTTGMDINSALALLSEKGFPAVNVVYASDEKQDMDIVLSQQPNDGSAQPGTAISLTVNSQLIKMPLLYGKTRQQALDTLEALYLRADVVTGYSMDAASDTVVLQTPAAGEELLRGDTVQIVVSIPAPVKYMASYAMKVPYSTNVRIVIVSPSGKETEAFNEDCAADRMIYLELESDEAGEHQIMVYYGYDYVYTDTRSFV